MHSHTEIELQSVLQKQARLRRIQEIEAESKTLGSSTAWYALTWTFLTGLAESIQETFRKISEEMPIFDFLYPDNPGTKPLLPAIAYSAWSAAFKSLSPLALAFNWVNTAMAFKTLWQKPNRTAWDYANVALSLAGSIAWTVLLAVGAAGAVAGIASFLTTLPYFIPSVFGVYAFYGFCKGVKSTYHAFQAWRDGKMDECKAHLKNAFKHVVSVVTNTLALVTSLFLGVKMQEAAEMLKNLKTFQAGKEAVTFCFEKASTLLYALGTSMGVGVVLNTTKMNQETFNMIRHPIDTLKKAWYSAKSDPLSALKTIIAAPIKLPLRLAALVVVGPIQGLAKLAIMGIKRLVQGKKPASLPMVQTADKPESKAEHITSKVGVESKENLADKLVLQPTVVGKRIIDPTLTDLRIKQKMKNMHNSFPSMQHAPEEIRAKQFHLSELSKFVNGKSPYRSVEQIEKQSHLISGHGLYRSNFRLKGSEVKEITEEVRSLAAQAA